MNDLDMELQTIRQKLQTLKASPPETLTAPWSTSKLTAPSPDLAQVTTAIETLRQRSSPTLSSPQASSASLQQFEAALGAVDHLAKQQQQAMQRLQSLGNRLIQQTRPGISPDIDDIARFLAECQTIQIPTIQRDAEGYLDLDAHIVDFHRAEQDASSNAETLRLRSQQLFKQPFNPVQNRTPNLDHSPYPTNSLEKWVEDLQHFYQLTWRSIQRWTPQSPSPGKRTSQFTLLDSSIWCIGAAIARLILHQLFQINPAIWPPVAFILIAGIVFNLYRAILSPRPHPILGYRTLMIVLGLLIGGRFI
ncbi:MAG: hypothetical protein AAGF93_06420 [Cyanobacteria bacterium P01_H01_bin.105]